MSLSKNEDRVDFADADVHTVALVKSYAGWVVGAGLTPDQFAALPEQHKALLGQSASRQPAMRLEAHTADGSTLAQTYTIERGPLAELILELVGTFLNREMFKQLVAALPEDWSR